MASKGVCVLSKDVKIEGVISTDGRELTRGAYCRIFTVKYCGLLCAAKEIHPFLIEGLSPAEKKSIIDNFTRECYQCSIIRHPNIVQFLGVYYSGAKKSSLESDLPVMVMELMDTSLASFIKNNRSNISMSTKKSILYDISLALSYLHARKPAMIHGDLSPNNIMLTNQPVAKIGELGVNKGTQGDSRLTKNRLATVPGTVDFVPPEGLEANPLFDTAIDVFSFAGISLHVFAEEWPTPCGQKRRDPETKMLYALSEAERRQEYLDKIPESIATLKKLIVQCLDDDPDERPPIKEVSELIEKIKVHSYIAMYAYTTTVCNWNLENNSKSHSYFMFCYVKNNN